MPINAQALSEHHSPTSLRLGPLHYQLVTHDAWGETVTANLHRYFPPVPAEKRPIDRTIHLCRLPGQGRAAVSNEFPRQTFKTILPGATGSLKWHRHATLLNTVWHSDQTCHALWAAPADESLGALRFDLPWDLLLHDLARCGGGIIHGGVAVHDDRAWLFLAPPGGGKSTTLATAPPDWQVLSDDAAMIWPEADGDWRVSPLLSWSNMLTPADEFAAALQPPQETTGIAGFLLLNKAEGIRLERLSPIAATPALYRSLHEYPINILADNTYHENFFRTAVRLARCHPCWRLDLPLGGNIWPELPTLETLRR